MGHAYQSELRRWDIVAGLCQSIDARTYVEVGCKEGRTTGFVLAQCPEIRAIAIDPWRAQPAGDDASRETYDKWDFAEIERLFWENIGANKDRCEHVRWDSIHCAEYYHDNGHLLEITNGPGFDVVFIDALHDYDSVRADISHWWELVNVGGYLCGHDFNHQWPGVERAVAEHFNLMDVGLAPDSVWFVRKTAPACSYAFGAQV